MMGAAALGIAGCGDEEDGGGFDGDATVLPDDPEDFPAWLGERGYQTWASESAPHPSAGPHPRRVRVYLNDTLVASLQAGNRHHPVGSVAIKEILAEDRDRVEGWSLSHKIGETTDDDIDPSAYFWFNHIDGETTDSGPGVDKCTSCHSAAFGEGRDHILSVFPLQ